LATKLIFHSILFSEACLVFLFEFKFEFEFLQYFILQRRFAVEEHLELKKTNTLVYQNDIIGLL